MIGWIAAQTALTVSSAVQTKKEDIALPNSGQEDADEICGDFVVGNTHADDFHADAGSASSQTVTMPAFIPISVCFLPGSLVCVADECMEISQLWEGQTLESGSMTLKVRYVRRLPLPKQSIVRIGYENETTLEPRLVRVTVNQMLVVLRQGVESFQHLPAGELRCGDKLRTMGAETGCGVATVRSITFELSAANIICTEIHFEDPESRFYIG